MILKLFISLRHLFKCKKKNVIENNSNNCFVDDSQYTLLIGCIKISAEFSIIGDTK